MVVKRIPFFQILLVLVMLSFLVACQGGDDSVAALEGYLQAVVDADVVAAVERACADWEAEARAEAESFESVEAQLDSPACEVQSSEGDEQIIACQGEIQATYGREARALTLAGRSYRMLREGGEWRMCGYR
jgi:hypothetical protein